MAKKKKSKNLSDEPIVFEYNGKLCKVISFKKSNMTVEIHDLKTPNESFYIPFAHLTKKAKALLKPNT